MFFRYEYNNFLHTQVVNCLHTVLANTASLTNFDGTQVSHEGKDDKEDDMRKTAPLLTHVGCDVIIECLINMRLISEMEDQVGWLP